MASESLESLLPMIGDKNPELEARKVYLIHQGLNGTLFWFLVGTDAAAGGPMVRKGRLSANAGLHRWLK